MTRTDFYCESDCMSEGKCSTQCEECALDASDEAEDGEDTNVEDSHGR